MLPIFEQDICLERRDKITNVTRAACKSSQLWEDFSRSLAGMRIEVERLLAAAYIPRARAAAVMAWTVRFAVTSQAEEIAGGH
jgi:hypothetical protein